MDKNHESYSSEQISFSWSSHSIPSQALEGLTALLTEVLTEVMIRRSMQKTLHTLVMSNL